MNQGLIHIYHGSGKGKTTCGVGLCVRAAGAGIKTLIFQFLKDNSSSEINVLKDISNITICKSVELAKFTFRMSEEEKAEAKQFYTENFELVTQKAVMEGYGMVLLDEVLHAVKMQMLDEERLIEFLKSRPEQMEVVLTGYDPSDRLRAMADYISCIEKEKHPYDRGIKSRVGIEK